MTISAKEAKEMIAEAEDKAAIFREEVMGTPKRTRTRLAQSELWMIIAQATMHLTDYSTPAEVIRIRYGLTEKEFDRLLDRMAGQLETKAMNSGYEEAWVD
jgi:hypothetical protein